MTLDHIGPALGARQHTIRFVVIPKLLFGRIPVDRALELHRNLMNQTRRAGSMTDFNWRDGRFSRSHALKPVAMMLFALVEMNLIWTDN